MFQEFPKWVHKGTPGESEAFLCETAEEEAALRAEWGETPKEEAPKRRGRPPKEQ